MTKLVGYMLDTNIVSHIIKGTPNVRAKLVTIDMHEITISAITAGELWFGLAKKTAAQNLSKVVQEFLLRVEVLPWDAISAACYGKLRAEMQKHGKLLGNLDLLIAAHAKALGLVLVTNNQAFSQIAGLKLEDWT
jgi:tRNA(fMet)-specific endonuclease VapC